MKYRIEKNFLKLKNKLKNHKKSIVYTLLSAVKVPLPNKRIIKRAQESLK